MVATEMLPIFVLAGVSNVLGLLRAGHHVLNLALQDEVVVEEDEERQGLRLIALDGILTYV